MRELAYRDAITVRLESNTEERIADQLVFHSSTVRRAATGLADRVRYMALAGRASETFDDVLALFEIKRLMMESPMLTGMLTANATRATAWNAIKQTLAIDPDAYTDDQLAKLQESLAQWIDEDMAPIIQTEEYFTILRLRDLYSETIDGKLSEEKFQMILEEYATTAMFRQILGLPLVFGMEKGKKRLAIEFAPLDQQIAMLKEFNTAFIADLKAYPPMVRTSHLKQLANDLRINKDAVSFLPAFQFIGLNETLVGMNILNAIEARSTIIVLAIHRHRLATGGWPESLEEISSEHLRVDPIDLHTDELLNYAIIDARPLLWSGGPDGDNDGGFAVRLVMEQSPIDSEEEYSVNPVSKWFTLDEWDALSEYEQGQYDGDWILFPP